jgi:hypothetical protein
VAISKKTRSEFSPMRKGVSKTLMGNQDTVHKGDSLAGAGTIPTTFRCPAELKDAAREYSEETGYSVTQLIIEGLEWRISRYRR